MAEFADRFKAALLIRGIKASELARLTDTPESVISQYKRGLYVPKQKRLDKFSQVLNVSIPWLMGADVPMDREDNYPLPSNVKRVKKIKAVPIVGTIACGTPIFAEQNIERYTYLPDDVNADFVLECKGNSMVDADIYDGDLVFVRQQPMVDNGEIAAVLIGEEATLKKVYKSDNKLTLMPANVNLQPLVYVGEEMEEIRILGKATALLRQI